MRFAAGAGYTPAIDKNAPLGMSVLGDDTPHLSCPFGSLCRLNTFCIFSHPERERGTAKRNVTVVGGMEPHVPARASSSALLMQLQQIEEAVARQMIPEERVVMLHRVSKAVQTVMQSVRPTARIKVKHNQPFDRLDESMNDMVRWCRVTARSV